MRASGSLLALSAVVLLAACEQSAQPFDPADPLFHHTADHLNAGVERLWGENLQWGFVRPRPPGIGSNAERVRVYMIAPVDENDPLSDAIELAPGVGRGEVDQVTQVPRGNRGTFRAIAQTVPVLHPGFNPFTCEVAEDPRIAWRWVDPAPTPCGKAAHPYAVDLVGDGECFQPLTSVARIEQAEAAGLAMFVFPPEPPWPFAARPITAPGQGRFTTASPACAS